MDQQQLIKDCIRQNRKAQEALYNQYKNMLFSLSLKYCSNQAEAEDNLHNAFLEIFGNIRKYSGKGSFEGWMKRITINKAITGYKKTFQLSPVKDDLPQEDIEPDEFAFPLDYILSLVQQLPTQYRLVFCLYELDDYPHQEIAAMLSISEGTSKSNLHRAKAILREKIKAGNSFHNYNSSNGK